MNRMSADLAVWLAQTLDRFELRVRAGRTKEGHDTYYCAGWADGYKAAHREARAASRTASETKDE